MGDIVSNGCFCMKWMIPVLLLTGLSVCNKSFLVNRNLQRKVTSRQALDR